MTPFEITHVDSVRYKLSGELDMASAPTLDSAMEPIVDANDGLTLELDGLTFIDSYGLRALVQLSSRLNGSGPLVLTKVPNGVQRVLDIVGMETLPGIEVRVDG
jgi:anti-anti-sigma factor